MSGHYLTYPLNKRYRHPCDRWGRQPELAKVVFLAVRDALFSSIRHHPDSKRTRRAKLEARARKQQRKRGQFYA